MQEVAQLLRADAPGALELEGELVAERLEDLLVVQEFLVVEGAELVEVEVACALRVRLCHQLVLLLPRDLHLDAVEKSSLQIVSPNRVSEISVQFVELLVEPEFGEMAGVKFRYSKYLVPESFNPELADVPIRAEDDREF